MSNIVRPQKNIWYLKNIMTNILDIMHGRVRCCLYGKIFNNILLINNTRKDHLENIQNQNNKYWKQNNREWLKKCCLFMQLDIIIDICTSRSKHSTWKKHHILCIFIPKIKAGRGNKKKKKAKNQSKTRKKCMTFLNLFDSLDVSANEMRFNYAILDLN